MNAFRCGGCILLFSVSPSTPTAHRPHSLGAKRKYFMGIDNSSHNVQRNRPALVLANLCVPRAHSLLVPENK